MQPLPPIILYACLGSCWADHKFRDHLQQLPEEFHAAINRYLRWQDKQRSLIGKLLLSEALKSFGYTTELLKTLKTSKYGKPFFENEFRFNISHSSEWIACGAGLNMNIGIDIEKIQPVELTEFKDTMSSDQWDRIYLSDDRYREFYRFWTAKEAII